MAGIQQPFADRRRRDPHLLLEIGLRELAPHQVALLDADAVLARQAAADLHAELEDVVARRLGLLAPPRDR